MDNNKYLNLFIFYIVIAINSYQKSSKFIRLIVNLIIILITIFLITLITPLNLDNIKKYESVVVLAEENEILGAYLSNYEQWCFPLENDYVVPEKLKQSVIQFEDKYFYYHIGFNPYSIIKAFFYNIKNKEIVMGGSTITMQLARIVDPKPRTYINKLYEVFQAMKYELLYSKDEILKLYLSYAPYGGNIMGIKAASLKYYKKLPKDLTYAESALFAVLPNSPGFINPERNNDLLINKRNYVLNKLKQNKVISKDTYRTSLLELVPDKTYNIENLAKHLTQRIYLESTNIITEKKIIKSKTKSNIYQTTINVKLQKLVERMLYEHVQYMRGVGIGNGACLVVNNKTGQVKAYAGSQEFFDNKYNGQVDGVFAPRSPGSTLKPFLYGLAIDEGLILPKSVIKDIPTFYGSFSPRNASKDYNGVVRAKDALIRSLNVPAVRLLNTFGVDDFYQFLKAAGLSTLFRTSEEYGLPLILGGSEVTIWDMAKLYMGMANNGEFKDLQVLQDRKVTSKKKLMSNGASYILMNMLKDVVRPGSENYWQYYENNWPLAWKTGTSYGHKDAWAIGVNPQYTIVVWMGNFTGEGNPALVGSSAAGPLLFKIFSLLPKDSDKIWFKRNDNDFKKVRIWIDTGYGAINDSFETELVDAPVNSKVLKICPYHKEIFVTNDEKYRVDSSCWEIGNYKKVVRTIYPPDVIQFLRDRGYLLDTIPPPHPDSTIKQYYYNPVTIIYPTEGARLVVPKDYNNVLQKVVLRAGHINKESILFWYLNRKYIGKTLDKHSIVMSLPQGKNLLKVLDSDGNSYKISFYVDKRN